MVGVVCISHISIRVLRPKFFLNLIISRPCFTKALFKPIRGTTSHTVPIDTRSKKFNKFGSLILFSTNQLFSLSFLFKATKNKNVTPAAHK
ncbi:hypothetical protein JI56_02410 [SAR11 cluster bacterium PRT-SC02]|nr:hypothetical protein JI56_02410 [SAR11 cluster bacterium PRT-SC02]